jgi:DNA-binding HxlR family transcriptional regulator
VHSLRCLRSRTVDQKGDSEQQMARADASASIEGEIRAGSRVLSVFENPLNTRILRAHAEGPQRLTELQERIGWAAESTVRAALANLCDLGALTKQSVGGSARAQATALSEAGKEMLFVADEVAAWLARCPTGPIAPESEESKVAVKAFAGGWSSTLTRALVGGPFTLTEMSGLIPGVSYPALERRIAWMRTTGQIEPVKKEGRGTPYVVTDWLRHAVAPVCAAGRCERRHMEGETVRATSVEVEAAFLLVIPLIRLRPSAEGSCVLALQTEEADNGGSRLAGVTVEVERGEILSCLPGVGADPGTWAVGISTSWLDLALDGRIDDLRIGGEDPQLALDLATGIHFALFGDR